MIEAWVLLICFHCWPANVSFGNITTQEFNNEAACNAARAELLKLAETGFNVGGAPTVRASCVKK